MQIAVKAEFRISVSVAIRGVLGETYFILDFR